METGASHRQVGAYRLLHQIGEGGMGAVWLAEHAALGRRAAIKLLHPAFSGDAGVVTRFFNEARAATQIADPGIVQIFDFGHDAGGHAYIAMELLEGEALDQRLHRLGRLPVPDAGRIMRQVASSLGAAHARNIVHRDLKPENVFLVRDPEVPGGERAKVLDFGIAKLIDDPSGTKTQANAVMGTPVYMSPEQCRGAGGIDARSDVYSLGCVLFTLLAGRPPFEGDAPGELLVAHLTRPAPPVTSVAPHVPASIEALIARCLDKDPAARFQNGTELAGALGSLLTSITGSGLPADVHIATAATAIVPGTTTLGGSAAQVTAPVASRPRATRWLAGGVAIAAIGAAIAVLALRQPAEPTEPVGTVATSEPGALRADVPAAAAAPSLSAPPTPPPAPAPAPAAPPAPAVLTIALATQPPGAQVFVGDDDTPRGVTPLHLELAATRAPVDVRVTRRGYVPRTVVIDGTSSDLTLVLEKQTHRVRRRPPARATSPSPATAGTPDGEGHTDDTLNPFAR